MELLRYISVSTNMIAFCLVCVLMLVCLFRKPLVGLLQRLIRGSVKISWRRIELKGEFLPPKGGSRNRLPEIPNNEGKGPRI